LEKIIIYIKLQKEIKVKELNNVKLENEQLTFVDGRCLLIDVKFATKGSLARRPSKQQFSPIKVQEQKALLCEGILIVCAVGCASRLMK